MILNNIIIIKMFNLMKWQFSLKINNEKKTKEVNTGTGTLSERYQSWKKIYIKKRNGLTKTENKNSPKDISFVNDIERGFQHVNCILHIIIIIFTVQNRDSLIQYTYTCTIKYITWMILCRSSFWFKFMIHVLCESSFWSTHA